MTECLNDEAILILLRRFDSRLIFNPHTFEGTLVINNDDWLDFRIAFDDSKLLKKVTVRRIEEYHRIIDFEL